MLVKQQAGFPSPADVQAVMPIEEFHAVACRLDTFNMAQRDANGKLCSHNDLYFSGHIISKWTICELVYIPTYPLRF